MGTLTFSTIAFAGIMTLSSPTLAGSPEGGPAYIGQRSSNAEQETFGYRTRTESPNPLAFIGPARDFGRVTGDVEKDTIAYKPLFGTQTNGVWLFHLEREQVLLDLN